MSNTLKHFTIGTISFLLLFCFFTSPVCSQTTLGAQFQVNSYTTNDTYYPKIGLASNGDFVVVWYNYGSSDSDNNGYSVQGQRYASNGSKKGAQFQINSYTTGDQYYLDVGVASNGDFVVVWTSTESSDTDPSDCIQAQRYSSDGSKRGAEFQVNSYTTLSQWAPSVGFDADGDFVIVWESNGSSASDTHGTSIQGQRFASNGTKSGAQFQINSYTTSVQNSPSVGVESNGDFVVVWDSSGSSDTDTSLVSIQGQRYASNGAKSGAEFQVNSYTTLTQKYPSVGCESDGDFVVLWHSNGSSDSDTDAESIQGQLYASNGSKIGTQFLVNSYTTSNQFDAEVGVKSTGDFVVVWNSEGSSDTDTYGFSVQGQRYEVPSPAVPTLSSITVIVLITLLGLSGVFFLINKKRRLWGV